MNEVEEIRKMAELMCGNYADGICAVDGCTCNHSCEYDLMAKLLYSRGCKYQTNWIPVTERLPEESGKYLVCTNRGNVYQTKFYSYPEEKGGHWGQKDNGKSITHWMPLPEPPERSDG